MLNLVNLTTPLGMLLAAAACERIERGPDGLWVGVRYRLPRPAPPAFTVGNVVLIRFDVDFLMDNSRLLAHEARHSSQYACLGLPFLPLYGACALWSLLRTGNPASRNFFERDAGLTAGGYDNLTRRRRPR